MCVYYCCNYTYSMDFFVSFDLYQLGDCTSYLTAWLLLLLGMKLR